MVFVTSGYCVLLTLLLVGIPLALAHYAALVLAISSTVGFLISMATIEGTPLGELELAPIAHAAVAAAALVAVTLADFL
jgi:hypothetical protein